MQMGIVPGIKTEYLLLGLGVGIAALWLLSRRDTNGDGKPDGLLGGLGYDAGAAIPNFVGGVTHGAFDSVTGWVGASDSDCAQAKRDGNTGRIYWACWPTDWPIFN